MVPTLVRLRFNSVSVTLLALCDGRRARRRQLVDEEDERRGLGAPPPCRKVRREVIVVTGETATGGRVRIAPNVGTQEGRYTKGGPLPMVDPIRRVMPSSIPLAKLGRAVTASTWQQTLRKYVRQLIQGAG